MIYRYRDMIYGFCRMIYLRCKYDILSVPSCAAGIFHPPQVDIILKVYQPFRKERLSLKKPRSFERGFFLSFVSEKN